MLALWDALVFRGNCRIEKSMDAGAEAVRRISREVKVSSNDESMGYSMLHRDRIVMTDGIWVGLSISTRVSTYVLRYEPPPA